MTIDVVAGGTDTGASVAVGGSATGTIDAGGDQDWFQVTLVAGHQYRFDVFGSASGLGTLDDPLLRLLDGAGAEIVVDDDSGLGRESSITFTASSTTYYLSVQGYGSTTGTFQLVATDLASNAGDVPAGTGSLSTVAVGGSVTGTIDAIDDQDWYQVALIAGREYRFDLQGASAGQGTLTDPVLRLLDGAGVELAYNDDAGGTLESSITFTAYASGTHFLSAQGFFDIGTFRLAAADLTSSGAGDIPASTGTSGTVAVNGSVTGTIDAGGDQDWYQVSLAAGHQYRFDLLGSASGQGTLGDPYLRLLDASGGEIASNDDAAGSRESSITFIASFSGSCFLSAQGFGSNIGTFQLAVTDLGGGADTVGADTVTGGTVAAGGSVTGTIDAGGDQDWYQVSLTAGHQYRFDLEGASAGLGSLTDPVLRLLNGSGTQVAVNDDSAGSLDSSITFTAAAATYFLSAQGFGSNAGTFRLSASDLTTSTPDVPANTGTGGTVAAGGSVTGTIDSGGDQDWYRITLSAGHEYRFDLLGFGSGQGTLGDPVLRLLDSAGAEIAYNDDFVGLESSITFTTALPGTYYLSAQGFGSNTGTFRLDTTDFGPPVDTVAANTGTGGAVAVGSSVTGMLEVGGDQDWYQVSLLAFHSYRFDLLGVGSGQGTLPDPYLRLLDASGAQILYDDDSGSGLRESVIYYFPTSTGTYFLSAEGYATNLGTFRLDVNDLGGGVDVPAATSTASSVAAGGYAAGAINAFGDQDWYRVTLTAGHQYEFDLLAWDSGLGTLVDPYLRLLNASGVQIAFNDDIISGSWHDSSITFAAAQSGNYFLSAEGFGSNTGTFQLYVFEVDVPGSLLTGSAVAVGGFVTGTIDLAGDQDWYQVSLTAGSDYRFDLLGANTGLGTLGDPYLRLLDASGAQVAFNDDSGGTVESSLTYSAPASGAYFLSAEGYGSNIGSFVLLATETGGDVLNGTAGSDELIGASFDDTLNGGLGDDLLDGKEGNDLLDGGAGADILAGGLGNDVVDGGDGADEFIQSNQESAGDDVLTGGAGNDVFRDHFGNNVLDGEDGDDFFSVFVADGGTNLVTGGDGQDEYEPQPGIAADASSLAYVVTDFAVGAGGDRLDVDALMAASEADGFFTPGSSSLDGFLRLQQSGPDTLLQWDRDGAGAGFDWVTQLTLKNVDYDKVTSHNYAGANEIGTKGDDSLSGALGDDTVVAAGGNDTLDGSLGQDSMVGGSGSDTYYVDDAKDVVVETSNAQPGGLVLPGGGSGGDQPGLLGNVLDGITDLVLAAISFSLENLAFVEQLSLTGTATDGTGNALANALEGNDLGNVLLGLGGNDTVDGLGGDDSLSGGAGSDTLSGADGADTLDGGTGIDTLNGGAGSDAYVMRATAAGGPSGISFWYEDIISETGQDVDTVYSNASHALAAGMENLTLTGAPLWRAYTGIGNELGNVITGEGAARQRLFGEGGADTLDGGAGRDVLDGGAGDDVLVYDALDASVNGGADSDTLRLDGSGVTLDLTLIGDTVIQNVEVIDLTGSGNNTLTLAVADVLAISSTTDALRIDGDAGDVVNGGGGWTDGGIVVNPGYHTWTQGLATLLVDLDITQNVSP